jgi:hypothetical protein
MAAFPSYSTGTVAVAANATVIIGTSTIWFGINVRSGGEIVVAGNTVTVVDVTDTTHLVIDPWPYAAVAAGAAYKIYQKSPLRFAGGQVMADVSTLVAALNSLGPIFNVPTGAAAPDPSLGNDGQYAHQMITDIWWLKTGGAWVVTVPLGAGTWTNSRLSKTAAYSVANADKGRTVALGGAAFYTLTLNAASGYDANFTVVVLNEDTGRGKTIAVNGLSNFFLWPGQSCTIFNQNNVWKVNPAFQRWKIPNNTTIYVDAINGNDANDGLAAGTGNAVKTLHQAIRVNIKDYFDLSGISSFPTALVTVQLADNGSAGVANANAYSMAHIAFTPVGNEGRCAILIQGNATTPSNTIIADSGGASVGAYGAVNIQLRNLQIGQNGAATPVAITALEASDGGNVRIQGGVILGTCSGGILQVSNGGTITADAGVNVVGGGTYLGFADGGTIDLSSRTHTFANAPNFSQQTFSGFRMGKVLIAGCVFTNGGTVTGTRYYFQSGALLDTQTATANTFVPGNAVGSSGGGAIVT